MTPRAIALAAGLLVLALAASEAVDRYAPHTYIERDGRFYVNASVTLVEEGSFVQDRFCASWYEDDLGWNDDIDAGWSNVAAGREGHRVPKHPWLLPVLSAPLFFAFGLDGLLVFNLLTLAFAAGGAALFAHGSLPRTGGRTDEGLRATAALTAALLFVGGTGVFRYAYNYHADTTLLGLWLAGLGALAHGRGTLAGVLLALTVGLKPTALMWFPSLLLLGLGAAVGVRGWSRLRTLRPPLVSGAVTLAIVSAGNAWIFGRPWFTGYTRTLIRVDGTLEVTANLELFSRELLTGLASNWAWLSLYFPAMVFALPGLISLARRRPFVVAAGGVGLVITELIFALYVYEGDRFHWPALALFVPALAESVRLLGASMKRRPRPLAGALAVLGFALALGVSSYSLDAQLGRGPTFRAAALLASGSLDARQAQGSVPGLRSDASTELSESRAGWWPRAPLVPSALLGPAVALGPAAALLAFLACVGLFGASLPRLLGGPLAADAATIAPPVAAAALLFAWPLARGPVLELVPPLLAVAALMSAGDRLSAGDRWAAPLAFLGAAALEAPLVVLALLPRALAAEPPLRRRALATLAIAGLAAAMAAWAFLGRPFATANDMALVDLGDAEALRVSLPWVRPPPFALALGAAGVPGLVDALRATTTRPRATMALLFLAGGVAFEAPLLVAAAGAAGVGGTARLLAGGLTTHASRERPGRWTPAGVALALLLGLVAVGGGRRALAATTPWHLASVEGVRRAEVTLGGQRCDFLAWEHLNWECTGRERGVTEQTGLQRDAPHRYGGERLTLFHLATVGARSRDVAWRNVALPARLALHVAPADHGLLGGVLELHVDGEKRGELALDTAAARTWEIDLDRPRHGATLALRLRGRGAAVGVDAELPR